MMGSWGFCWGKLKFFSGVGIEKKTGCWSSVGSLFGRSVIVVITILLVVMVDEI
jgi:hypothetical protein